MKTRFALVVPVGAFVALPTLGMMAYAGFLSADWGTLLACLPAILAMIAIVACLASGVIFFGKEEDETPEEAARPGGAAIFEWLSARLGRLAHRTADRLHHRLGH